MKISGLVRRAVVGISVATFVSAGAVAASTTSASAATCRPYTAIAVRGTNDGARSSSGTQLPTAVSAFAARKGSTYVTKDYVSYQATFNYAVSMSEGRAALRTKLSTYLSACPKTKVALFGYSQGAHIVGDVVVGLTSTQRARIHGVGLIGDPMLNPTFSSSKTADRTHGGMWGRRASWPTGVFVYNVCNKRDQVCASFSTAQSTAYLAGAAVGGAKEHLTYTSSTYSPIAGSSGAYLIGRHVADRS